MPNVAAIDLDRVTKQFEGKRNVTALDAISLVCLLAPN